jgi:hypothetical protein
MSSLAPLALPPAAPMVSAASLCGCIHLTGFLASHPQSGVASGRVATQSAALTSVAQWMGAAASSNLLTAIPTHAQPATELQAMLQTAIALQQELTSSAHTAANSQRTTSSTANRLARLAPLHPHCSAITCGQVTRTRLACLECTNVGCWTPRGMAGATPAHSRQHAQDQKHSLGE